MLRGWVLRVGWRVSEWLSGPTPLGERAERLAAWWLRGRGYRIMERRLVVGRDEADIVALDPDGATVVIVEVKARSSAGIDPETALDAPKRRRLRRLADRLGASPAYRNRPMRIDAVAIVWPEGGAPELRHYRHAADR